MKRVVVAGILALGLLISGGQAFGESFSSVQVSADALNVREFNNQDSKLLGQAGNGQVLIVVGDVGEWYAVRTGDNALGYVKKDFCQWIGTYAEGHVTGSNVNLRATPSTEGAVVAKLQPADVLQVTSRKDGWYKVTFGESTGYIREDMLVLGPLGAGGDMVSRGGGRQELVAFAKQQLGKPYSWGKAGPDSFDCSGFVTYVYKNVYNKTLERSSAGMSKMGTAVEKANLAVGDLVFFGTGGSSRINHVGIYIGGGSFIHASSSRTNGYEVTISPLDSGYYAKAYKGARRVNVN